VQKDPGSSFTNSLHIFVLSGVAIAQPILDVLSRNTDFLVATSCGPAEIFSLVLILCFLLPASLILVELIGKKISNSFGMWIHYTWIFGLGAIIALQVLKHIPELSGLPNILISILVGILLSFALVRFSSARFALTCLSPFVVIIPALFLNNPRVQSFLTPETEPRPTSFAVPPDTSVVFLIFDQLPVAFLIDQHGQIDETRFPNFARLAKRSTWYRNTTTVHTKTTVSVTAILTGLYPLRRESGNWHDYPNNLFLLLGGYHEMNVIESASNLCPRSLMRADKVETHPGRLTRLLKDISAIYLQVALPAEYAAFFPPVTGTLENFWDNSDNKKKSDRATQFEDFLSRIKSGTKPALHFAHVNLPHGPMQYLPSGNEYLDSGMRDWGYSRERNGRWLNQEWLTVVAEHQYLLQVAFVDRLLGKLLDRLQQTGLFDKCLIVVTSDHGVAFWPGESNRALESQNRQDIQHVPFFIKLPFQQSGSIEDRKTETVDILPSVADALKIQIPWSTDGRSALNPSSERCSRKMIDHANRLVSFKNDLDFDHPSIRRRLRYFSSHSSLVPVVPTVSSDIVGKKLQDLTVKDTTNIEIEIMNPNNFQEVDRNSGFIPAMIAGYVRPATDTRLMLAIAVNGIVRTVTYTFPLNRGKLRFSAMIAEDAFRNGQNKIEVFALSDQMSNLLRTKMIN
jgi:hypothetical protein